MLSALHSCAWSQL